MGKKEQLTESERLQINFALAILSVAEYFQGLRFWVSFAAAPLRISGLGGARILHLQKV